MKEIVLLISAAADTSVIWDIRRVLACHPGHHPVTITTGMRRLSLGPRYNCDGSPEVRAKLSEFGSIIHSA